MREQSGFSLLEPLIALLLGIFIAIPVLKLEAANFSALTRAKKVNSEKLSRLELQTSEQGCRKITQHNGLMTLACTRPDPSGNDHVLHLLLDE